ncbi:MAG: hypothetical protein HPY76_06540 [Anaerolineae bacterium]|nr:hypothetical protein [Anaerolineae bacterium]
MTLFLAACARGNGQTPSVTPLPQATAAVTATPVITPTLCAMVWEPRYLEALSSTLYEAYQDAGIPNVQVYADAYGENCLDYYTKDVAHFTPLETNLHITVQVATLDNDLELGNTLAEVLPLALQVLVANLAGSQPGYVEIRLVAGDDLQRMVIQFPVVQAALERGLTGENLYRAFATFTVP